MAVGVGDQASNSAPDEDRIVELPTVPTFSDPILHSVLDGWLAVRGDRRVPKRSALDPLLFPRALSSLWIARKVSDDFVCELCGENIRALYTESPLVRPMSQLISPKAFPTVRRHYDEVLKGRLGYALGGIYSVSLGRSGVGERLVLPLADPEGHYRFLLGVACYRIPDSLESAAKSPPRRFIAPLP